MSIWEASHKETGILCWLCVLLLTVQQAENEELVSAWFAPFAIFCGYGFSSSH